jgi:hypothetical protein
MTVTSSSQGFATRDSVYQHTDSVTRTFNQGQCVLPSRGQYYIFITMTCNQGQCVYHHTDSVTSSSQGLATRDSVCTITQTVSHHHHKDLQPGTVCVPSHRQCHILITRTCNQGQCVYHHTDSVTSSSQGLATRDSVCTITWRQCHILITRTCNQGQCVYHHTDSVTSSSQRLATRDSVYPSHADSVTSSSQRLATRDSVCTITRTVSHPHHKDLQPGTVSQHQHTDNASIIPQGISQV